MTFSSYVRALGRGPGRSRTLTEVEAQDAMSQMLAGSAAPEAVGALLMLMRYRGETAAEVAGFARALRAGIDPWPGLAPAIDWPSYAAGRTRGLPWFLLSARLLADAGLPVLLHGWNSHQAAVAPVRAALQAAGIAEAQDMAGAEAAIGRDGISYLSLQAFAPDALRLLQLRDVLGLRSAVNTALRMINPAGAATSLQGVFHPPYRSLQSEASALLSQSASLVIKGGGGECERHPGKHVELWRQSGGRIWADTAPPVHMDAAVRLAEGTGATQPSALADLWSGALYDPFATAVVTGTAALALLATDRAADIAAADSMAQHLWSVRQTCRTLSSGVVS